MPPLQRHQGQQITGHHHRARQAQLRLHLLDPFAQRQAIMPDHLAGLDMGTRVSSQTLVPKGPPHLLKAWMAHPLFQPFTPQTAGLHHQSLLNSDQAVHPGDQVLLSLHQTFLVLPLTAHLDVQAVHLRCPGYGHRPAGSGPGSPTAALYGQGLGRGLRSFHRRRQHSGLEYGLHLACNIRLGGPEAIRTDPPSRPRYPAPDEKASKDLGLRPQTARPDPVPATKWPATGRAG